MTTEEETKDLDIEDSEDIGRRHRKRKKHHNQNPCSAGYGKTFGQEYTYISAPMINYFFGCPTAPVQLPIAQHYGVFQHGHQGSTHHHGHGHGHGQGSLGQGHFGYGHGNQGYYGQGQFGQSYLVDGGYQQRPLQNVAVSAAAALANYITRPKKVQKQINQFLRPVYNFL